MNKRIVNDIIKVINDDLKYLDDKLNTSDDKIEKYFIKGQKTAYIRTKMIIFTNVMADTEKITYLYNFINSDLEYKITMKNLKSFIADLEQEEKHQNILDYLLNCSNELLLEKLGIYGY